jgi:hypothetical protein
VARLVDRKQSGGAQGKVGVARKRTVGVSPRVGSAPLDTARTMFLACDITRRRITMGAI